MKRFFLLIFLTVLVQWSLQANHRFANLADTISVSADSLVHNQCFGESAGKIFLTVQAALPVTFSWSNGDSLQNIEGLPTGFYGVTVSDTTGSQVVLDSIFIGEPSEIAIGFSDVIYPDCIGGLGELTAIASGGVPDYSYLWSTGDTLSLIDSLVSGLYEITVTDANGCQAVSSFMLQPLNPVVSLLSTGNINCLQSTVTLNGTGSQPNSINFEWLAENGGHFSTTTDSLVVEVDSAGTYTLTITDTLTGCSSATFVLVEIDTLVPVVDAGADTTVVCENTVIGLSGTAANGTSFSYNWTASNGGLILEGETTDSITVGESGLFTFEVVNLENGCQATDSVAVNALHPAPTATVTDGELNCYFPSINLPITADTTDKSFSWTGPNGFASNELSPMVNEEGTYAVQIIDTVTTCSADYSIEIIDNQGNLNLIVEGGILNCNNSNVTLGNAHTSGDAVYDWAGPNGFNSIEQNPTVTEAGDYILLLTDTLTGCTIIDTAVVSIDTLSPVVVIAQPTVLNCQFPTLNLDASGSTLTNTAFAWTTTDGNILSDANTASPLINAPGTYLLTLTDTLNGCSASGSTTVTGDFTTPIISTVGGSFDCFEGVLQIFGVFDTTGVVFEWTGPNGYSSTIQDPFVNAGGEYILTVVNIDNGCAVTDTATVLQIGEVPILTVGVSDTITCTTPSVQLTAAAQISTIDWSWASPNGFASTEQNPMTTFGGWHFVVAIETTNGCIALDSVFVEMDTELPLANAGAGLAFDCFTSSTVLNGMASTGPEFSFVWNTTDGNFAEGEDTLTPTVDQAGTYTLTVTDESNGCVSSDEVVITQTPPVAIVVSSTDAACFGGASGTGTVVPSGGVGNYSIAWSSGSTSSFAQGLVVGNYSVTVTDGDGCSAVGNIVINQPDLLVANASATGETLAGLNDGTATANPTGGTMPYNYNWSNNETTQSISPLAPGVYKVTVTDDNNCMSVETVNVNEFPCTLTSSISATHVNCFGDSTGTATVVLENATLPFSFIWSNGDTTATISNLPAGTYSVIANDSTLCKNELTVVVNEPTPIQITELFHENVDCQGEENGFVIVGVNGGVQPYSFLWSNGDVTPVSNGLGTGLAELVVTDGNGCEATFSTTIITNDVTAPQLVLQDVTVALDQDGLAALNAAIFDAGTTDNCGTFTLLVEPDTFDCSALGSQQVSITAIDESGNVSTGTAFVQIVDDQSAVLICPDNIVASACNAQVSFEAPAVQDNCAIDPANLIQTEGLSSSSVFPLGTTTVVFGYTDAGQNSSACSFDVTIVDTMQTEIASSNVTCAGVCNGSIQLDITGGILPYQIDWSNDSTTTELNDLCAGSYTVTISDASGCTFTQTIEISEPSVLELAIDSLANNVCASDQNGNITVTISGGTGPYAQLWSDGSTDANLENAVSGTYTLVVTDANNCEVSIAAEIISQIPYPQRWFCKALQ
ncbi:MAG: HYR domain-containing protein [Saprospiraceae bacterium]